jgi:hypothetical protein
VAAILSIFSAVFAWMALASISQFLLSMAGLGNAPASFIVAVLGAAVVWRFRPHVLILASDNHLIFRWGWILAAAFALAQLLVLVSAWKSLAAAPHGDWDAWSI